MNTPQYDTDAEPIVQLTDMPVVSESMEHSHQPVQPILSMGWSGFDKTKLILPISILIAAVLISGSIFYTRGGANQNAVIAPTGVQKPIGKVNIDLTNAMILGDAKAPVMIVEYADFQCPFCERYFKQNQTAFISQYVNSGKVRFAWKDYAFLGQESVWAAEAARCANDQGKFWEYHDYLFNHQGAENSGAFSKANLKKFASALSLNAGQFNKCLDSDKYASLIQKETQEASTIGVNGTPATFINGQLVADSNGNSVGAAPFTTFQAIIDKILTK
ncbi:MAG: DsbA family protein [Patescibacteria group bacterium]